MDNREQYQRIPRFNTSSPTRQPRTSPPPTRQQRTSPPTRITRFNTSPPTRQLRTNENASEDHTSKTTTRVGIPKIPQVITTWKSRFIKAYMLIMGIIIITTGLFMIDESCGCIRKEDKLLSWSLKLYVFLGIIMLVLGLFFSTETKKMYIGYCTAFLVVSGIALTLNSWIIKKAKEMFESIITGEKSCRGKTDDSRFLSYSIVGITILSITVFTSIMLLVWVIYRSTKSVYTSNDLEYVNSLSTLADLHIKSLIDFRPKLSSVKPLKDSDVKIVNILKTLVDNDTKELQKVKGLVSDIIRCMNQISSNPDDISCKQKTADPNLAVIHKIFSDHKSVDTEIIKARLKYEILR